MKALSEMIKEMHGSSWRRDMTRDEFARKMVAIGMEMADLCKEYDPTGDYLRMVYLSDGYADEPGISICNDYTEGEPIHFYYKLGSDHIMDKASDTFIPVREADDDGH